MTQSPQSGQAAPRNAGFDSVGAPRHASESTSTAGLGTGWGSTSTTTGTGTAPGRHDGRGNSAPANSAPSGATPVSGPPSGAPASAPGAPGRTASRASRARGPRRARLQLRHINAWTVLKFSCVLAIALFFVWLIVVGVLFGVLDGAGIIDKINNAVTTINGPGSKPPVTAQVVFGGAAIIGVVNIVLFIALSTVGSVVYNLCADLVGGIEVTLSER